MVTVQPVEVEAEPISEGMPSGRRSSARLRKLKADTALRIHTTIDPIDQLDEQVFRKKQRLQPNKLNTPAPVVDAMKVENEDAHDIAEVSPLKKVTDAGGLAEVEEQGIAIEKSPYIRVTETLRLFNKHYLHFVQEEEKRCEKQIQDKKNGSLKSKNGDELRVDAKRASKRPDLKAISKMIETKAILNPRKMIGSIPGIDVGYQFFSRAEMVVVGLHSHWLNGIDYIGQKGKMDYKDYRFPITTVIVLSGQYEDDLDNYEDIVYTGQGGNDLLGKKHQIQDQVMQRGNLGLKNSMEQGIPIRVVRGHQSRSSYVGKVYTYDGLYKVVRYWAEKGVSGFTVYKFQLKRLEGQPLLTTDQVHFTRGRISNSISEIRGLVCEDITGGQEAIPVPVTNMVDDPPIAPAGFTYRKKMKIAENVKLPQNVCGCNCKGACYDARSCACAKLNGCDFPYVHRDGGRLVEPRGVVFECGPNCGCGMDCVNRTSQRGIRFRLEVYRTPRKGWAVRSWDYIPSGSPICEYIGVLRKSDDIDNSVDNCYVFDIDCLQTMKGLDGREKRLGEVPLPAFLENCDVSKHDSMPEYCIDAGSTGNFARFINHSCQPNLFVQCVLSAHHDMNFARVVLFAADNIPPLKELTYDYGYVLDSVSGPDGTIRQMPCYCGEANCRKRLF